MFELSTFWKKTGVNNYNSLILFFNLELTQLTSINLNLLFKFAKIHATFN